MFEQKSYQKKRMFILPGTSYRISPLYMYIVVHKNALINIFYNCQLKGYYTYSAWVAMKMKMAELGEVKWTETENWP